MICKKKRTNNDSKLISIGGMDTAIIVWSNLAAEQPSTETYKDTNTSIKSTELLKRNAHKGESDDSDTDSENEGYVIK